MIKTNGERPICHHLQPHRKMIISDPWKWVILLAKIARAQESRHMIVARASTKYRTFQRHFYWLQLFTQTLINSLPCGCRQTIWNRNIWMETASQMSGESLYFTSQCKSTSFYDLWTRLTLAYGLHEQTKVLYLKSASMAIFHICMLSRHPSRKAFPLLEFFTWNTFVIFIIEFYPIIWWFKCNSVKFLNFRKWWSQKEV